MSEMATGRSTIGDVSLDVRYAIRTLRRTPGFTVVALLTLALGIGAATAMFSVLNVALRQSLPYLEPDELVYGRPTFSGRVGPWVSLPDYLDYQNQSTSFASMAAIAGGGFLATITGNDEPAQALLSTSTSNLFATLGVLPHIGRFSTLAELPESGVGEVVIGYEFWQRWYGGSRDALGSSLIVNGGSLTVVGVLPKGFHFYYDTDLWVPPWPGSSEPVNRRYHNWRVVGRMAPGVTLEEAQAEIDVISAQLAEAYPDSNRNKGMHLDPLHAALAEGYSQSLLMLSGAIALVLFIACGNVASLLLARGSARTSEMAMRTALGASGSRLARQLGVECLVLSLAAGCIGIVLAVWLHNLILGFLSLDRLGIHEGGLSVPMLAIAMLLTLGTVVLIGVFPARQAARTHPAEDLKRGSRRTTSGRGFRFRSGLVIFQVALSVVLLVGSGLLIRSLVKLRSLEPGFRVEKILTATVALPEEEYKEPEQQIGFFESLEERIRGLAGVESVGIIDRLPILHIAGNVAIWDPENPPESRRDAFSADRRIVLPGFFETMEVPVLEGRALEPSDNAGSQKVIVLNQNIAESLFGKESAVGRLVEVDLAFLEWDEPAVFEVVGVVENYTLSSLGDAPRSAMFFPFAQQPRGRMRLAAATAIEPEGLIRPIQECIWELDRNIVLSNPQSMEDVVADSVGNSSSVTTVLSLFTAVALALAALGLHGVLSFFVAQRAHEIGIRAALGASRASVLRLVVSRGMVLVGIGVAIGTIGAVGAARLIEGFLFEISAVDPATVAGAAGFFFVVALAACMFPAWRALKVDPMEALRIE